MMKTKEHHREKWKQKYWFMVSLPKFLLYLSIVFSTKYLGLYWSIFLILAFIFVDYMNKDDKEDCNVYIQNET